MDPFDLLDGVNDEATFLEFARALSEDRKEGELSIASGGGYGGKMPGGGRFVDRDERGWRNFTIEDFLDAGISWAESTEFGARQGIDSNPWRRFATFLYLGKIYD